MRWGAVGAGLLAVRLWAGGAAGEQPRMDTTTTVAMWRSLFAAAGPPVLADSFAAGALAMSPVLGMACSDPDGGFIRGATSPPTCAWARRRNGP